MIIKLSIAETRHAAAKDGTVIRDGLSSTAELSDLVLCIVKNTNIRANKKPKPVPTSTEVGETGKRKAAEMMAMTNAAAIPLIGRLLSNVEDLWKPFGFSSASTGSFGFSCSKSAVTSMHAGVHNGCAERCCQYVLFDVLRKFAGKKSERMDALPLPSGHRQKSSRFQALRWQKPTYRRNLYHRVG